MQNLLSIELEYCHMSESLDSIGVSAPTWLIQRIDKHRAKIGFLTGDQPSRSEWWREAAREKLERDDISAAELQAGEIDRDEIES